MSDQASNNAVEKKIDQILSLIHSGGSAEIELLLDADNSLADAKMENDVSLLMLVLYCQQFEVATKIANLKQVALTIHEASAIGDWVRVTELLELDPCVVNELAADGFAPLHLAAFFDRLEVLRLLLANGAEVDCPTGNEQKICPLHSAAASRSVRTVRVLLSAGANPDVQQKGGFTALHSAAKHGNLAMVKSLLAQGANTGLATDDGLTALEIARSENHSVVVDLLA